MSQSRIFVLVRRANRCPSTQAALTKRWPPASLGSVARSMATTPILHVSYTSNPRETSHSRGRSGSRETSKPRTTPLDDSEESYRSLLDDPDTTFRNPLGDPLPFELANGWHGPPPRSIPLTSPPSRPPSQPHRDRPERPPRLYGDYRDFVGYGDDFFDDDDGGGRSKDPDVRDFYSEDTKPAVIGRDGQPLRHRFRSTYYTGSSRVEGKKAADPYVRDQFDLPQRVGDSYGSRQGVSRDPYVGDRFDLPQRVGDSYGSRQGVSRARDFEDDEDLEDLEEDEDFEEDDDLEEYEDLEEDEDMEEDDDLEAYESGEPELADWDPDPTSIQRGRGGRASGRERGGRASGRERGGQTFGRERGGQTIGREGRGQTSDHRKPAFFEQFLDKSPAQQPPAQEKKRDPRRVAIWERELGPTTPWTRPEKERNPEILTALDLSAPEDEQEELMSREERNRLMRRRWLDMKKEEKQKIRETGQQKMTRMIFGKRDIKTLADGWRILRAENPHGFGIDIPKEIIQKVIDAEEEKSELDEYVPPPEELATYIRHEVPEPEPEPEPDHVDQLLNLGLLGEAFEELMMERGSIHFLKTLDALGAIAKCMNMPGINLSHVSPEMDIDRQVRRDIKMAELEVIRLQKEMGIKPVGSTRPHPELDREMIKFLIKRDKFRARRLKAKIHELERDLVDGLTQWLRAYGGQPQIEKKYVATQVTDWVLKREDQDLDFIEMMKNKQF